MKNLILINGTMGVGKSATCRELQKLLPACVFLDGDWCWQMRPFTVTPETKAMVLDNISYLLNRFLACSAFENVLFCWVMHEQAILDAVRASLRPGAWREFAFSLTCTQRALRTRIGADVAAGRRQAEVLARSLPRLPNYARMDTEKVDVSSCTAAQAAQALYQRIYPSSDSK